MTCHYCGAILNGRSGFCLCCGTRQTEDPTPVEKSVFPAREEIVTASLKAPEPAGFDWSMEEFPDIQPDEGIISNGSEPRLKLPVHRGLAKMLFLGILTLGIYPTVIWSRIVTELNIAASWADGKRTMPYFAMVLLTPITLGIFAFVWMHKFCSRVGAELERRDIEYRFGARDFWLWNILGCLILVGPFVFVHKLMRSMNQINTHFNMYG